MRVIRATKIAHVLFYKSSAQKLVEDLTEGVVWWSLHKAVSRNHTCEELGELVEFAEGSLQEKQPFRLKLGEDYEQLKRSPP